MSHTFTYVKCFVDVSHSQLNHNTFKSIPHKFRYLNFSSQLINQRCNVLLGYCNATPSENIWFDCYIFQISFPFLFPGTDNPEEFDNTCDKESEHSDASHDASLSQHSPSSTVSQSLEINFPTSDNVIYSPRSEIITNEVVIPQSTLPDHILQSQGDEPAFFIWFRQISG